MEFSFDIDMIPFAVPFRMKSAFLRVSVLRHPDKAGCPLYLFHTVDIGVMNIEERPVSERQVPWQFWLV